MGSNGKDFKRRERRAFERGRDAQREGDRVNPFRPGIKALAEEWDRGWSEAMRADVEEAMGEP